MSTDIKEYPLMNNNNTPFCLIVGSVSGIGADTTLIEINQSNKQGEVDRKIILRGRRHVVC